MRRTPFGNYRQQWTTALLALVMVLSMLLTPASILAQDVAPEAGEPAATTGTDDADAATAWNAGEHEVAAYYMSDYGGDGNLPNSQANVTGFYNTLRYHPWYIWGYPRWCNFSGHDCYIYGNSSVWEDDFVDNNNNYIDSVDVVFYEGHGWPGGFTVRAPDDEYVQHGEVQGFWGNVDLEWMFLLSCSVIADSSRPNWYGAMNGMHGIAGFRNTAYDVSGFGASVATNIVFGYSYKDSWFKSCDTKQPSGVQAQIIVEDSSFWNESAYNQLSDLSHDGSWWYWWKSCGAPGAGAVTAAQLNNTFPAYSTPPLSLAEAERELGGLSTAFQIAGGTRSGDAFSLAASNVITVGASWVISDTAGRLLEMDSNTGQFYYYDPERTFTAPPALSSASPQALLTEEDAQRIASQFLTGAGLLPQDAVFNTVDRVVTGQMDQIGAAGAVEVSETTTGYQVIFNRYLPATVVNAAGVAETVQIPVDGPGSKIKVYVDPTAGGQVAVATANQLGSVVGAMGGWREVSATPSARADITLLDYETQVKPMFGNNVLRPLVAYEDVPLPDAATNILTYTVSGWEEANGESQDLIYPAYRIDATYQQTKTVNGVEESVVFTGSTWIAANPEFMRPFARIDQKPADKSYKSGDTVEAMAADASQTLAALGFGSALNFVMGMGDTYLYNWYLGDVETGKPIGQGDTLSYALTAEDLAGVKDSLTITLQVVNSGTSHTSISSSTISHQIRAVPPVYLPSLIR